MPQTSVAPFFTEEYRRQERAYPGPEYSFFGSGQLTAGSGIVGAAPDGDFDTGAAAAANRIAENVEGSGGLILDRSAGIKFWARPQIAWVLVEPFTLGANPARFGIEIGSFNQVPPFTNPRVGEQVMQLFGRFDPVNGDDWRLTVNNGTTPAQTTVVLAGVAPLLIQRSYQLMLVYQPGAYVRAYVNGILGAEVTTVLPDQTAAENQYAGVFVTTEAAASRMRAFFNALRAQTPGIP